MYEFNQKQLKKWYNKACYTAATPSHLPTPTTLKYNHQDRYQPLLYSAATATPSRSTAKLAPVCITKLTPISPHLRQPLSAADQLPWPERKTVVPSTKLSFLYLNGQPPTTILTAANNQNCMTPSSQFFNSKQIQNTHSKP
jgi:hypothetical protein